MNFIFKRKPNSCPNCGSTKKLNGGKDEYFVRCYGNDYQEHKNLYVPDKLAPIQICGECGVLYAILPKSDENE